MNPKIYKNLLIINNKGGKKTKQAIDLNRHLMKEDMQEGKNIMFH